MRIVGAREKTVFISEMKKALNLKDQSFDKLKSKADNENNLSAAYSVGLTYLERGEYNEAQSYLLKASQKWAPRDSKRNKLLTAQIGVCNASANDKSATESQKKSCITIIETALAWFLRVVESLERHDQLASLAESVGDKEKKALTHQNALKLSAWFISNYKAMKNEEWTLADLHSYRASQFDGLDNKEEVEKEYHLAYEEFSKLIKNQGKMSLLSVGIILIDFIVYGNQVSQNKRINCMKNFKLFIQQILVFSFSMQDFLKMTNVTMKHWSKH